MVNDHVGPKGNRLKVSESPFGTITCLKIGYMAWKKRIGHTLENRYRLGMKDETQVQPRSITFPLLSKTVEV